MFKYIKLHSNVYFCRGIVNSILLDCNNIKIYHLDDEATKFLELGLKGQVINCIKKEQAELINYLYQKELIVFVEQGNTSQFLPECCYDKKIKIVWLELRKACNMKCLHCYNESTPTADSLEDALTIEQWQNVVVQLKSHEPSTIVLIGGEPLMYKHIKELMMIIRMHLPSTKVVLYSNLSILNDEVIDEIVNNQIKVVTSIYSSKDTTHDAITQVTGSFNKTIDNVKKLKNRGVDVRANTVVMSINQDEILSTREFIKKLTGHNPKSDVIRCVTDELMYLQPTNIKNPHIISSKNDFMGITEEELIRAVSGNSCWQGKINITYDGYVTPCIMWDKYNKNYNVKENSLDDILINYIFPTFWNLSKDRITICKDCEYRFICRECRPLSQSLEKRGNICHYNPYTGNWTDD